MPVLVPGIGIGKIRHGRSTAFPGNFWPAIGDPVEGLAGGVEVGGGHCRRLMGCAPYASFSYHAPAQIAPPGAQGHNRERRRGRRLFVHVTTRRRFST